MAEIRRVRVDELRIREPVHETLPDEILGQVDGLYEVIGRYIGPKDEFITNLRRDQHPDREMKVWIAIAAAWIAYHNQFTGGRVLDDATENALVGTLIGITCGVHDEECQTDPETTARLRAFLGVKPLGE